VNWKLGCHQITKEAATRLPWETGWSHRGPLRMKEDWAPFSSLQKKCVMNAEATSSKHRAPDLPLICLQTHSTSERQTWWPQCCVPLPSPTPTSWLRSLPEPSKANAWIHTHKKKKTPLRHCFAQKQQL